MSVAAKDVGRISLARLSRLWVDIGTTVGHEFWVEMGHFYSGFDMKLQRIVETDGFGCDQTGGLGYKAQGTFEPAQNAMLDYRNYVSVMNGKRGVAILVGDRLRLFRQRQLQDDYQDNRISLVCSPSYNAADKASGNISGYIDQFELYQVKDLTFANNQLRFTIVDRLFYDPGMKAPDPGINN